MQRNPWKRSQISKINEPSRRKSEIGEGLALEQAKRIKSREIFGLGWVEWK